MLTAAANERILNICSGQVINIIWQLICFRCDNLSLCQIEATSTVFPSPCPSTPKYLEVLYSPSPNIQVKHRLYVGYRESSLLVWLNNLLNLQFSGSVPLFKWWRSRGRGGVWPPGASAGLQHELGVGGGGPGGQPRHRHSPPPRQHRAAQVDCNISDVVSPQCVAAGLVTINQLGLIDNWGRWVLVLGQLQNCYKFWFYLSVADVYVLCYTQQRVVCVHWGQWDIALASVTVLVLSMSLLSTQPNPGAKSFPSTLIHIWLGLL